MNKKLCFMLASSFLLLAVGLFFGTALAETDFEIPEGLPPLKAPILVTTCGQSPGALMVKVISDTIGLACDEMDLVTAEELADICAEEPYGVLFVTTGTSLKGMDAAGIDIDDEVERCLVLIEKAKELGIVVVVGQIEGPPRRVDEYDEKSIQAMTPLADLLITRSDVNEDGYFTQIAEENGIPQIFITETLDLQELFPILFAMEARAPELVPPIVTTTCGQSPGALMVKVICQTIGLACDEMDVLTAEELADIYAEQPYGVLFVTTGTSLKGMGAAGIDVGYEVARCVALVEKAKELGIVIIVGQIEGPSRRVDEYDEKSIQAMTPLADLLITRSDVNEDGYFTQIAEENGIPQIFIDKTLDLKEILPILFGMKAGE